MEPNQILGVPANAGEEEIRAAYLSKVKEFPPDREPAAFERIRDAYEALRDPRRRACGVISAGERGAALVSLIEGRKAPRIFTGPQAWREVLKNK